MLYIGSRNDNAIAIQLQPLMDKMPNWFKLDLAFSTLHLVVRPDQPCPLIPELTAEIMIVDGLSQPGKLELVRALMEQVRI